MISSEKMLLIEKYFSGHLDRTELCTFENLVSVDREFRNEVNRRSSFEADLFGLGTAGELQDEQVVEDCLARSQVLAPTEEEERAALKSISEQEWDEIIDGAVNAVYSSSGSRITFFRKYAGFLMAACFAGMVMAGYAGRDFLTGWLTHRKDSAKSGWYVDSPGHKQKTLPEDSLVRYNGGAVLMEKNSVAFVHDSRENEAAELKLVRGRLLLASRGERGREIRITTPQVTVTSRKAMASVSAESGVTVVSVDSGSVKVSPVEGGRETEVSASSAVVAGKDSVLTFLPGLDAGDVRKRKLLGEFLRRTSVDIPEAGFDFGSEKEKSGPEELLGVLPGRGGGPAEVVRAFRELPDSVLDENILSSIINRMRKQMGKEKTLELLDSLCSEIRDKSLKQMIHFRKAGLSMDLDDTASAVRSYLSSYDRKPGSRLGEESLVRLLQSGFAERFGINRDSVLDVYLGVYGSGRRAGDVLFAYANSVRTGSADYHRAMKLYEELIESFPDSRHRDDAVYWIGWCLIQERINRRSSGINREKLFRPDGHLF